MTKTVYPSGLDLITVNYRTPHDLQHHLASLEKNPPTGGWRIVVVNVDETDEERSLVREWQRRLKGHLTHMAFYENVGYATAVNVAAYNRGYDTLGIFNADTRFLPGTLDTCFHALWSKAQWGVLGPRQVDSQGRITHAGFFGDATAVQERAFHHRNSDAYGDIRDDALTVSGAAYFIKRELWQELTDCAIYQQAYPKVDGAFLPTPHYYEETWCSSHARSHDWKVVYFGQATMIHEWHKASPVGGWAERQIPESRAMFRRMCDLHEIPHS